MQRTHTCDVWVWAKTKGAAIVWCRVQAVCSYVARYRIRKVEKVQHILGDFTVPHPIGCGVIRSAAIWMETLGARREVDLGHRDEELGSSGASRRGHLYILPDTPNSRFYSRIDGDSSLVAKTQPGHMKLLARARWG